MAQNEKFHFLAQMKYNLVAQMKYCIFQKLAQMQYALHLLYCYMHCYREKVKYATNRCGFYYFSFVNRETLH
jgi:heme/copper-type cytochrome/quinol oxidase subunit 4